MNIRKMLMVAAMLIMLNINPAEGAMLDHIRDDIGFSSGCSYYVIKDFDKIPVINSQTLNLDSKAELVGSISNERWEWETPVKYNIPVFDKKIYYNETVCEQSNITQKIECHDEIRYNEIYKMEERSRLSYKTFSVFKNEYDADSSIRSKKTQNVRFCADIERENVGRGFEISVDIIPECDGLVHSWLNWWNRTFLCRQEIFSNATTGTIFNVNDENEPNAFTLNTTETIYVYFENIECTGEYAIANETDEKEWENASSRTGNNPTSVWGSNVKGVWHLDEGSGTTAYDSGVNGVDGAMVGTVVFNNTDCVFGRCSTFDGGADFWNMSSVNLQVATGDITLEAWVKTEAIGTEALSIIAKRVLDGNWDYRLTMAVTTGYLTFNSYDGTEILCADASSTINDNAWHHVAATFDDDTNNVSLYKDGIPIKSCADADSLPVTAGSVRVGAQAHSASPYYFNGNIDEPRIWNRTLSHVEIEEHYNNGINNLTALGSNEELFSNTTLKSVSLDVGDFNFSSSSYVPAQTVFFNSSHAVNLTIIGSMNIYKFGSAVDSDVFIRIKINDSVVHEESLRTVEGTINPPFDEGSTGVRPFDFSVPTGEHNITIEFRRTGGGTVAIDDIDLSMLQFKSEFNKTVRNKITDFEVSFSNTDFEDVFNWSVFKSINSSTAILTKMSITATIASTVTCSIRNILEDTNSPVLVRSLSDSTDEGSASTGYIEIDEQMTHNHSLYCKTTGGTATINGSILDFDLVDSNGNPITSFHVSDAVTDGATTINLNAGINNIVNISRRQVVNQSALFLFSSVSIGTSTGEQTPIIFTNSSNISENILFSKKERYLSDINDIGSVFMFFITGNIPDQEINEFNIWGDVGTGETVILYDESLNGFEVTGFSISAANLPPLPNSITAPANNSHVSGESEIISWLAFIDPNGDAVDYNVYINNTLIASGIGATQTSANYSQFGDGSTSIIVEGCDPSNSCANSSIDIIIDTDPPLIVIFEPSQGETFESVIVSLLATANETIDVWWISINGTANVTFIPNGTITALIGQNDLVLFANDTAGNIGSDNVTFTVVIPISTRSFCLDDEVLLQITHEEACSGVEGTDCNTTITRNRLFCQHGCANQTLSALGFAGCQESPMWLSVLTIVIILVGAALTKRMGS